MPDRTMTPRNVVRIVTSLSVSSRRWPVAVELLVVLRLALSVPYVTPAIQADAMMMVMMMMMII